MMGSDAAAAYAASWALSSTASWPRARCAAWRRIWTGARAAGAPSWRSGKATRRSAAPGGGYPAKPTGDRSSSDCTSAWPRARAATPMRAIRGGAGGGKRPVALTVVGRARRWNRGGGARRGDLLRQRDPARAGRAQGALPLARDAAGGHGRGAGRCAEFPADFHGPCRGGAGRSSPGRTSRGEAGATGPGTGGRTRGRWGARSPRHARGRDDSRGRTPEAATPEGAGAGANAPEEPQPASGARLESAAKSRMAADQMALHDFSPADRGGSSAGGASPPGDESVPLDGLAGVALDRLERADSAAAVTGQPPDYAEVIPLLESLEPAAMHPETSGLADSLAVKVIAALEKVRSREPRRE